MNIPDSKVPDVRIRFGKGNNSVDFAFGHATIYQRSGNGSWSVSSWNIFREMTMQAQKPQIAKKEYLQ